MRTKLMIAALAVVAFAALPAVASATTVNLRDEEGNDPASIRLTSTNLTTTTGAQQVACARSIVNATRRGAGRYTPRTSTFTGGARGNHNSTDCPVNGTGGRVEALVRPVTFRSDITFDRNGAGVVRVSVAADFELLFRDPTLNPTPPHGFRECKYSLTAEGTMTGNIIQLDTNILATLTADRFANGCAATALLNGSFEVTDRLGGEVIAS